MFLFLYAGLRVSELVNLQLKDPEIKLGVMRAKEKSKVTLFDSVAG